MLERIEKLAERLKLLPFPAVPGVNRLEYTLLRTAHLTVLSPTYAAEKLVGEWVCLELGLYNLINYERIIDKLMLRQAAERWATEWLTVEDLVRFPVVCQTEIAFMLNKSSKFTRLLHFYRSLTITERELQLASFAELMDVVFQDPRGSAPILEVTLRRLYAYAKEA